MKRVGDLWRRVVDPDNLWAAYLNARKGKRSRADVAAFCLRAERELLLLHEELSGERWQPGAYRHFKIYDNKPRIISAAPFRDRVVHHAVMRVVEPILDRRFIPWTYACRKGKGVHKAVNHYQRAGRRYAYALKLDVRWYFQSIDHEILKQQLRRRIKDARVLRLLNRIIDHSAHLQPSRLSFPGDDLLTCLERPHGITIGNLTSQIFANLYLNDIDQEVDPKNWTGC